MSVDVMLKEPDSYAGNAGRLRMVPDFKETADYLRYLEEDGPNGHPVRVWKLAKEIETLRMLLWLKHGDKHVLYGDDGEMQCNTCWIDFKRDPIERIEAIFNKKAIEAANEIISKELDKQ